jgi:hypothetical protein
MRCTSRFKLDTTWRNLTDTDLDAMGKKFVRKLPFSHTHTMYTANLIHLPEQKMRHRCYLAGDFELLMPIFASPRSSFDPFPVCATGLLSGIVGETTD